GRCDRARSGAGRSHHAGRAGRLPASALEHDPEKACPRLDRGWAPVFGKDHAPTIDRDYWPADEDAQTATSGLLAGSGTTPHDADRSVRKFAALRFAPQ